MKERGGERDTQRERHTYTQINSMDGRGSSEVDGIQVKVGEIVVGVCVTKRKTILDNIMTQLRIQKNLCHVENVARMTRRLCGQSFESTVVKVKVSSKY